MRPLQPFEATAGARDVVTVTRPSKVRGRALCARAVSGLPSAASRQLAAARCSPCALSDHHPTHHSPASHGAFPNLRQIALPQQRGVSGGGGSGDAYGFSFDRVYRADGPEASYQLYEEMVRNGGWIECCCSWWRINAVSR